MARIMVASSAGGGESSRPHTVLARWATYHTERIRRPSPRQLGSPATELIETTQARQLAARDKMFEQRLPFSWLRFFVGLVSLVLVFSDVVRGGLGVSKLDTYYPSLQPDEVLDFGTSWNYSVFGSVKADAYNGKTNASVWAYKFDSTSIAWRAFASHFNVTDFPDCLLYKEKCPGKMLDGGVVFRLIDAIVDEVATSRNSSRPEFSRTQTGPVGLTLRTENDYIDRFHQFLLPNWFTNYNWRTNQALYYSPELLEKTCARSICFPANGGRVRTPHFCHELWTNLDRSCALADISSRAAGLLYVHTFNRLQEVQTRFPNATVDLTFLESQEDLQVCRGGLSSTGFRRSDVSTIIRARECHGDSIPCETVFLEDYRYETGLLISDVVEWYRLVATLRATGQVYFWLRGIGLILSCYFVHGTLKSQKKLLLATRLRKMRNLFMKVPTQCVVYGSSFPVVCYVMAHLLDAPFTYNVLESNLFSQAGVLHIKPELFVSSAVVQMRSIWIYALTWHVFVILSRSCGLAHSNRVSNGITGVPEFLLSGFSSVTLIAQYRSTSFRSSKVLRITEISSNTGRGWEAVKYQYSLAHRGRGTVLLGGVIIDLKFLVCLLLLVIVVWAAQKIWIHYGEWKTKADKHPYTHCFMLPPTPVPYSAGVLWPAISVCVQWPSAYYCIRHDQHRSPQLLRVFDHRPCHPILPRELSSNVHPWRQHDARVLDSSAIVNAKCLPEGEFGMLERSARKRKGTNIYRYIQQQLKYVHRRSDSVEANVAFMNAVLMSDPLVYLNLMVGSGHSTELAYYQSLDFPRQIVLLPTTVVDDVNEFTGGLTPLRRVKACELTWSELVQCG